MKKHYLYLICISLIISVIACNEYEEKTVATNDSKMESTFVGSKTCQSCHADQFEGWEGSHHDKAMQLADSVSVLADFNNTSFKDKNNTSTFFKRGGEYFVKTQNETGGFGEYKIEYTFGVYPLQQYIVKFPNGAYQCLLTAWDVKENKWFHLQPDVDLAHDEWLNWSGGSMRWNAMCADCHSTNLQKNFDPNSGEYNTTFSEINVGCESCHGPASSHVDYYQDNGVATGEKPKFYMTKSMDSKELVDKCARCHSRRSQLTKAFDYTGKFDDHYRLALPIPPNYEEDGQIKNEDYVYGSFLQSKMYHNGVSCIDCHDVHTLKLKKQGNALCISCHESGYDDATHHFHETNSTGAECINCHMPGKMYMGNDFRRDHSFRVPRPDQSLKYGTSNACNGCHNDKTAKWASDVIVSKFGKIRADHFSDSLLAGYHGSKSTLKQVAENGNYPNVIRASALREYGNRTLTSKESKELFKYLNDSSQLVRNEVVSIYNTTRNKSMSGSVEPLLMDSFRLVRIAAAGYFNAINSKPKPENVEAQKKATRELLEQHKMSSDFSAGQHQIALYYQNLGNNELAIRAYLKAIEIDSYANSSRMNLAFLYYNKGDVESAEKLYLKVIETEPDFGYSYYMLGLLYNEIGANEKSLLYFSKACSKKPIIIRAFYNYAIKLQEIKDYRKSVEVISKALVENQNNEELLYLKLIAQINLGEKGAAKITCTQLLEISPNNPNYLKIMERIH